MLKIIHNNFNKIISNFSLLILLGTSSNYCFSQWVKVYTNTGYMAYDIAFVNDSTGVLATYQSFTPATKTLNLMRTADYGTTWTYNNMPTQGSPPVLSKFSGDTVNVLCSDSWYPGSSMFSPDGGLSYQNSYIPTMAWTYHYKYFRYGIYNQGGAFLYRAKPGAMSLVGTFTAAGIQNIWMNSFKDFFVISGNKLFTTNDTGATWNVVASPTVTMTKIFFSSLSTGYITCTNGYVMKSTNGGMTWNSIFTGVTQNLNGLSFKNDNLGYVVGNNGTVLKTTNGGASWLQETFPNNLNLTTINLLNKKAYILINDGLYIRDIDTCSYTPTTPSLSASPTICVNSGTMALNGMPPGGTYSGPNVNGPVFTAPISTPNPNNLVCYTFADLNGCFSRTSINIAVLPCVGIEEHYEPTIEIVRMPNPNSGSFKIRIDDRIKNSELLLFNSQGKKVFSQKISGGTSEINLSDFEGGIYYYELIENGSRLGNGNVIIQ